VNVRSYVYLVLVLVLTFYPKPSYAYVLYSGYWSSTAKPSTNVEYYVDSSVTGYNYDTSVSSGASAWNGISLKYGITSTTVADSADIKVFAGDTHDTSWADTLNYKNKTDAGGCWSCSWNYSRIRINAPVYQPASSDLRTKVMIHEFGHAAGMDHETVNKAIMKQGDNGYYTMQTDDKDGLKAKYPN